MPNHLRKRHHRDPAQLAKLMIDIASGEVDDPASPPETPAREFARQGGLKGGRARANKPPERRAEMAKIACRRGFSTQTTRRAIRSAMPILVVSDPNAPGIIEFSQADEGLKRDRGCRESAIEQSLKEAAQA